MKGQLMNFETAKTMGGKKTTNQRLNRKVEPLASVDFEIW